MPKSIEVDEATMNDTHGKFELQPLERGFGITLGNALRRVLLSSIQGAAIDSIRIKNIHHEFSTIPGVVEDVPEIILNFKEVDIKLFADEPVEISIDVKGPKTLTAGDLAVDSRFEIMNIDHHIAQIDQNGRFVADIVINDGRGYVPSEEKTRGDRPIDTILIDSIYSPIRKVNFHVGNAWDWRPPRQYRFVYTLYDCVPREYLPRYVYRIIRRMVAPEGRLILGAYGSSSRDIPPFDVAGFLKSQGFAVAGTATGGHPPITSFAWTDKLS